MRYFIDIGELACMVLGAYLISGHYGLDMGAAAFLFAVAISPPFGFEYDGSL
jgi:hypothetical protein